MSIYPVINAHKNHNLWQPFKTSYCDLKTLSLELTKIRSHSTGTST